MATTTFSERSVGLPIESPTSGVSWSAVLGGASITAALWLALLALGAGFGMSIVSPWTNIGASATTVGTTAIIWLAASQVIASGTGGYLTGRLRTKWAVHTDEVYFRDTANGFLAWAVALVIGASALTAAATAMIDTSSARSSSRTAGSESADPNYYVDMLLRADNTAAPAPGLQAEAGRIFSRALVQGVMPLEDKQYLGRIVASRTGLAQNDAESRVEGVTTQARQAADAVRKVAAHVLLWTFLALLMGAFTSSFAATIGGKQRDHVN